MLRFRAGIAAATGVAAALALTMSGRAQQAQPFFQISDVGLPGVEEMGAVWNEARVPWSLPSVAARSSASPVRPLRAGASGRPYFIGRVLVRFRDEVTADERRSLVREATPSGDLTPRRAFVDFDTVQIAPAEDAEAVATSLRQHGQVLYAQPAYRLRPSFVPNDPSYQSLQWNMRLVGMEQAWDIQPQAGSTIIVAVIDTGVAYKNATFTANLPAFANQGVQYPALGVRTIPYAAAPDLVRGACASRIVAPFDMISRGAFSPIDFDGHGTHVSGTIGQLTNDGVGVAGVAFNVRLMPIKALGSFWDTIFGTAPCDCGADDDVAAGIRYAADNGAKVINMSLGSSGPGNCAVNSNQSGCSPVIEAAMRYAVGKGTFIAVAGGNEFQDLIPPFGTNPTSVLAEIASRIKGVVSVAAVDPNRNRASYSSTGNYIEIAAPGGDGRLGRNGFVFQETFDFNFTDTFDPNTVPPSQYTAPRFDVFAPIGYAGTSMATPHFAGIAAMLVQQGITDPAAIEDALELSADRLSGTGDVCPSATAAPSGRTCSFGFGLVNARNALRGLGLAR